MVKKSIFKLIWNTICHIGARCLDTNSSMCRCLKDIAHVS